MAASRTTCDADAIRVDLILARVGSQPADGALDIMNGRGKLVLRRQAVIDGRNDVAMLGQANAKLVVTLPAARAESAAGNRLAALLSLHPVDAQSHHSTR